MKNVAIKLGLKLAVLTTINLLTSGPAGATPQVPPVAPPSLHFVCSSNEIGVVDIKMNLPLQSPTGERPHYYDMTVTQSSLQGNELARNSYDTKNENFARAILDFRRPNMPFSTRITFTIPSAGQIDWNQHSNDCYIPAPAPGIDFVLDLETMSTTNLYGNSDPIIEYSIKNPRVENRIFTDIGFGRLEEYLNNQKCSTGSDPRHSTQPVQCKQIN